MSATTAPPVRASTIPAVLTTGKRFVAWRYETRTGQPTKVPYSPNAPKGASTTAPADWVTFAEALRYSQVAGLDGIGIVVTHEAGLAWLDLDHCRNPETGVVATWAAEYVKRLDTYTEVSPSGTGSSAWRCMGPCHAAVARRTTSRYTAPWKASTGRAGATSR